VTYISNNRIADIAVGSPDRHIHPDEIVAMAEEIQRRRQTIEEPIPMRLPCPACGRLHIDEGEFATKLHHTHACQACGMVWRPAIVATVGVRFLPGFKNTEGK
jgi:predicted RNA-binding Zn-ribbon protein involved in translation (DUF1610 family)